jgi:hypothetical protein
MLSYIGAAVALWFAVDIWITIALLDGPGRQRPRDK